jgi:hypothetical protein
MAESFLPGYGDPDINRAPVPLAATGVVTAAAFISVVLKVWVRAVVIKSVGWDDRFMVMSMVSSRAFRINVPAAALSVH